ncbi:Rid family hydrolase [Glutamicibacter sp. JL.03c]|uniref:RidA family protein n=1 Tax=Glutamicibacter sp. JL.03c TaxID=2984842 RepID=UPI0021F7EA49|nr:Rid family hydrolase [Glutamicibacter sp. JL.03c]UYQ77761.1 Rid family hydrolase [Glutamicibacter sp. JL.03c]
MPIQYIPTIEGLSKFGDYSPVAVADNIVAIAGQFGTDGEDPESQIRGAFKNLKTALAAADLGFEDIIKFTTFVVGRETIPHFMKLRKEIFAEIYPNGIYPPNTLLIVAGLVHEEFVFEVEAIAQKKN